MNDNGLGNIPQDVRLQLAQSKARDDLAKQTGSWSGDYDYGKSDQIQAANGHYSDSGKLPWHPTFSTESAYSSPEFKGGTWTEDHGLNTMYNPNPKVTYTPSEDMIKSGTTNGLVQYMKTREPDVELRMPSGVILPIEENKYKQVQYDRYKDDMQNSIEDKALQKGIEAMPLATVVSPVLKGGIAMVSAGKVIPGIGFAFGANDAINGYTTADRTFNNPDIVEKLANASATVGNGLSLGLLPIDKAAKGLASLVNNKYYGTLDDIVPDENRIRELQLLNRSSNSNTEDGAMIGFFKSISNGLGQIAPNKKEDFKSASIGIRG